MQKAARLISVVIVRHEVAQLSVLSRLEYPVCSCRTLRRRACHALCGWCEALRTMYRIGFER
jgi:hypothetical protein